MVHILSYEGVKINSFRPHAASVTCLRMDESDDFVATSSVEGGPSFPSSFAMRRTKIANRPRRDSFSKHTGILCF